MLDLNSDDEFTEGDALLIEAARTCERLSGGQFCVAARNMTTGANLYFHAGRRCKTASVIKLPILVHVAAAVSEGRLSWDQRATLTDEEKVGGAGVLRHLGAGISLSLRDLCTLMIVISDNTATNILIDLVGVEAVNARMRSMGLIETQLFRKSYTPDTEASRPYGFGVTTPYEMLELLVRLTEGTAVTAQACRDTLEILSGQADRNGIPRLLSERWSFAGKSGAVDTVRNDVGIATTRKGEKMILAMFCNNTRDLRWSPDNAGLMAIAEMSKSLSGHWFPATPAAGN